MIALVYLQGRTDINLSLVDEALTYQLLVRFSGYFSIAECLRNLGCTLRPPEFAALRGRISSLIRVGIVDPGSIAPGQDAAMGGTVLPG
jgi:hypothetical protein